LSFFPKRKGKMIKNILTKQKTVIQKTRSKGLVFDKKPDRGSLHRACSG
jgi:hypothetical protein